MMVHRLARSSWWAKFFNFERILQLSIVMLVTIVATLLEINIQSRERAGVEAEVERRLSQAATKLNREISELTLLADGLVTSVEISPDLVTENFEAIAGRIAKNNKAIINVALIPDLVISHVYPLEQNKSALGLELSKLPEQFESVNKAFRERSIIFDGPVQLVQGGQGLIVRGPVFRQGAEGIEEEWGLTSLVLNFEMFLEGVDFGLELEGLSWRLSRPVASTGARQTLAGRPQAFEGYFKQTEIFVPGQIWILEAVPERGWMAMRSDRYFPAIAYALAVALFLVGSHVAQYQRRQRETAEDRLKVAIEALTDGFALYDRNDRLVTCNEQYRKMYAESADMIVPGRSFEELIREGVRRGQYKSAIGNEEEWIRERMRAHREANADHEQQLADGRWIRVADRRLADGSLVGFRVDITDLKTSKERAEAANRAKTEFLSALSHELRTPLTVILGFTKLLENQEKFPRVRAILEGLDAPNPDVKHIRACVMDYVHYTSEQARKITRSGTHLLTLINDLLDYSRIEAGHFDLEPEPTRLDVLAANLVDEMSEAASNKGLYLELAATPVSVDVDPVRIRQILINLIGNAIKFSEDGGVTVCVEKAHDFVILRVKDTGRGIAESDLERVFEAFEQVEKADNRNFGGVGLGLAISKKIVELHGGAVWVTSALGKGTEFVIQIPRHGLSRINVDDDGVKADS
ncbi:MAG: PAS-domain containing protein [Rhodobacteraceae bacterium]|nr:PAS-domain containing protein [Paracoccaceae bacterium]